ncbi:hypothetical protein PPYR_08466 [Photinus pyralis]|uniref:SET domain-containing protein n=1 Tax=Photinus pyralis TaxID=7054 RepID=A0A5N4AJL0_PHOPY|nr:SET domain-containing protein SmydA-8-like isoform X4 [Photinus pyralis]KAB0797473.1 hypothetical protein PPYR_08466 [Photinus pyralis]
MDELNYLITEHLKCSKIYEENAPWVIKNSNIGGRGLFANRDIEIGEVIYRDNAIILGPRSSMLCPMVCVSCYSQENLYPCSRNCGLPICSEKCENSDVHFQECQLLVGWKRECLYQEINSSLMKCLTPIRSLLLADNKKLLLNLLKSHHGAQHGYEVDILKGKLGLNFKEEEENLMRLTCTVLDANSFEVTVGNEEGRSGLRGLYPLSSLMNHSCSPNTMHNFDKHRNMIVKAAVFIEKGQELFHSYTRLIWGTPVRRTHLERTKHFFCTCSRCNDPTEFGTNISGIVCQKCGDVALPLYDSESHVEWKCATCKFVLSNDKVCLLFRVLGSRVSQFDECDDVEEILKFLKRQIRNYLPPSNQISIELKYRLVWILGHNPKYLWNDLSDDLLKEKEEICRELLKLLEMLRAGQSKMRGLILYELYRCMQEWKRRYRLADDHRALLEEAKEILKDDVNAPKEIQNVTAWIHRHVHDEYTKQFINNIV